MEGSITDHLSLFPRSEGYNFMCYFPTIKGFRVRHPTAKSLIKLLRTVPGDFNPTKASVDSECFCKLLAEF